MGIDGGGGSGAAGLLSSVGVHGGGHCPLHALAACRWGVVLSMGTHHSRVAGNCCALEGCHCPWVRVAVCG